MNLYKTVKFTKQFTFSRLNSADIVLYCKNEGFKEALDILLITYLNINETGPEILKC